MLELSPAQIAVLERCAAAGFTIVAFPMYASAAGVRKGNCAALLSPIPNGGMRILVEPCYLVEGNLTVRIQRGAKDYFVWKKTQLEATTVLLAELAVFRAELDAALTPRA
jgi:hypothetical protein